MYKKIVVHVDDSPNRKPGCAPRPCWLGDYRAYVIGSVATGISCLNFTLLASSMAAQMPLADFDGLRNTATSRLDEFSAQAARLDIGSFETRLIKDAPQNSLLVQACCTDPVIPGQVETTSKRARPPGYRGPPIPGTTTQRPHEPRRTRHSRHATIASVRATRGSTASVITALYGRRASCSWAASST